MAVGGKQTEGPEWQMYLAVEEFDEPLHALRPSTIKRLSLFLDVEDPLMHGNCLPNYEGLAEKVGFTGLEINAMGRAQNHTRHLLREWMDRKDLMPTIGRLVQFLLEIQREDVLEECVKLIKNDIQVYRDRAENFDQMQIPVQDETVSQGPGVEEIPELVTRQDVDVGQRVFYDAFICYNPLGDSSKDLEFVRKLIDVFENPPFNFKLFVPWRDDLAGLNKHSINAMLISQRCRHMIVVLSQNFLRSQACEFQSTYAHALSPGARNKRLVPVKIDDCPTPNILRIMACCDFTRKDLWDWSWQRLARSIMIPLTERDFMMEEPCTSMDGLLQPELYRLRTSSSSSSLASASSSVSRDQRNANSESGFSSMETVATVPIARRSHSPTQNGRRNVTAPVACNLPQPEQGIAMEEDSPSVSRHTAPVAKQGVSPPMTSHTAPVTRATGIGGSLRSFTDRMKRKKGKDKGKMGQTE